MKKNFLKITVSLLAVMLALPAWSATTPKREHRSVWVTTAWRMCWPTEYGTTSTVAAAQQAEAIEYLDLLQENGFNCVYFQVRGMSDAMYKSSYEPWSSYVSGTRGSAPAYDPLEFWITECHKRGMELFAWVNPYRYESAEGTWGTADYRKDHSDWLLTYNSSVILNPGMEEVQTRIVDVCREIVGNYDVDGLVFDDYFYINSIPTSYDSDLYNASGSSLSQADWRRENVNTMVRKVYNMVKSTKPYVKFGISPAGVSKTNASKYGISTSSISSASDWQYSQIYSDPLAWLGEGTVDFISPQLYWLDSHSTNGFDILSEWWSSACADVFGRHFYASHSISFLNGANTESNWAEVATQVQHVRDFDKQNAPGSVYFGSRDLTGKRNQGVAEYLRSNKYQNIALPPCLTFHSSYAYDPGTVTSLALSGTTLSWSGFSNMRYVVYAVPESVTIENDTTDISSEYIINVPYSTSVDVSSYTSGYKLGVSVLDRYGYEYDVVWLGGDSGSGDSGSTTTELEKTTINTPADGSTVQSGFTFGWTANAVSGVSYRLEISTTSTFDNVMFAATTGSTSYSSSGISLTAGTTYYWRVITSKEGYTSSTSYVGSFSMATSGSSTTTPTDLVKDPETYSTINGYSIESLWIYSINTSNFPSQLGGDQRAMTAYNGKLYVVQRDGLLLEFSAETGEYIQTITLTGDCLTSSDGSSLGYKCNDIFVDGSGNLCVSNMTLNNSTVPLTVCTIDVTTGATTRVFEATHTNATRIDYAAARGNVTASGGEIWAAAANSNYVYRWTRNSSGSWTAAYTTVGTYFPSDVTSNSTAPRIMPISSTQFVLDGHNSAPALHTFNANSTSTYVDGFGSNSDCAPTANNWNGLCQATLNGTPIFAYVSGIAPNTFNVVTNPSNFNFASMTKLWTLPANGLGSESNGYVSAQPVMVNNSDGSVTLFLYTPNNGIAAYKLTSTVTATPQLDAVSLSTPVGGNTVSSGFSFGWSSITGATYTLEVSTSSSFSTIDFSASTTSNSYSSSNFNLATGTTYYWRVKASKDGYLSSTSSTASFVTAQPTLDAVTLTSPIGGATVEDGFTFNWSAISGATYTLEISAVATFASTMYSIECSTNSYSSASLEFMAGTKYYWRVKADTDDALSSTSSIESFTTKQAEVVTPETPSTDTPKDEAEYSVINNLKIESLWLYSIAKGNFHEELGRDQRGMAAYNGKVYVSERADGVGYLLEFDGETGEFLRKITLTGDYLTTSSGNNNGYPCNDVFVDGGGHLCVSNMMTSQNTTNELTICSVDVNTGATTRIFESDLALSSSWRSYILRFDYCGVYGDLTQTGAKVYAAAAAASYSTSGWNRYDYRKRVYCWTRNSSGGWDMTYVNAGSFYPTSETSTFGNAPRIFPVASSRIVIDGSTTYPTLYSYGSSSATIEDSFDSNANVKPAGMLSAGMCSGEVNGQKMFIYSFNDDVAEFHNFAIVSNPNDYNFADMELMWKIPQAGLGNSGNSYVSSIPATQANADGSMNLYIYTPSNGLGAYRISDVTSGIEGVEAESGLTVKVKNDVIVCSQVANSIELFTASGVKVAEVSNSKTLNVANITNGIYLVRATTDTATASQSIVIK